METEWETTTKALEELKSSEDGEMWGAFCEHAILMLVNFCKRLGLSEFYAEEVTQETMLEFIKAFRNGKYIREKGRLRSWLFGMAVKVMRNLRRRLWRQRLVQVDKTGTCCWDMIEDQNAVKHAEDIEWGRMVLTFCLEQVRGKFTPQVIKAFELYAIQERPADEVAEELNMSRSAVYAAKHKVLARMRKFAKQFDDKD